MHTHRTLSEATAKTVFSLYGDNRNTGARQTPKGSSAIAVIYQCRIYISRSSASSRSSADNGTYPGGGRVFHTRTRGLDTLYHQIHHRRTTPHRSTQLLGSPHYDELQARPPTIDRPFQIYLTHRTTLPKRIRSNDTQVPLRTARSHHVNTYSLHTHTAPHLLHLSDVVSHADQYVRAISPLVIPIGDRRHG